MELKHPFVLAAFDAVMRAPADPDAAGQALLIAAEYIRRGEPLPMRLAEWLADAIETAIQKPERLDPCNADPGAALLFALHLRAHNRRPIKVSAHDVHNSMLELNESGSSVRKAAKIVGEQFEISVSTAKRLFKEHQTQLKEVEADRLLHPDNYG